MGVDLGSVRITALLRIDERGKVLSVSDLDGPSPFVALVAEIADDCTFEPARFEGQPVVVDLPFAWDFPEPPIILSGSVRSRGDHLPVIDAILLIGDRRVRTDTEGHFEARNLPPGPIAVQLQANGMRLPPLEVNLGTDEALELELWVFQDRDSADEIVATYDPRAPGPTRRILDRDAIRAMPGSLGDPVRALQSQPGFARSPFDAGWLLVRGGDFDDTGVYLDGVRMPLLFHMGGFTSVLHPELTQAIHYWAGAPPARFQGTAGAVNVLPADPEDQTKVVAGINLAWAHAFASTPTKSGGVAVAARRSYLDTVVAAAFGKEAAQIAPRFADVQGRWVVGESSFTVLGLTDSLDAPSLDGGTLTVSQAGFQAQGRIPIDVGRGKLIFWPWAATHTRGLTGDIPEDQLLRERFPGLRVAYESPSTDALRWDAGLESELRSWTLFLGSRQLQHPAFRMDPWVQAATGERLVFESGLRLDTLWVRDQLLRTGVSPRTSLRWHASEALSLHGELGRFHGPPYPTLLIGLPDGAYLPLEQSDMAGVGLRAKVRAWTFEADVYRRRMAYLGTLENDGTVAQQVGRARGLETQIAWTPEPIALSLLYQLARTERIPDPGDAPEVSFTDQPHRVQLLQVSHLPRRWTLSSRFRYGSGFPRTLDPEGIPQPQVAVDLLTQQDFLAAPGLYDIRLPPFYALDVKISKQFQFRKWRLDAFLDVQNLTNRRVAEPLITGFGESEHAYGFGLPVLPLFGVEGVFWPDKLQKNQAP
jgi:hypothetical protein